mmetsp:Transcript_31865/g.61356  ORF Transcript_31865/g.61356 Transcript_31865/m.61356 type:complete len:352 (-) Transcript_31865:298-1353(-)|eukprot:CAMPEP_0114226916 /NCGR_PEP_ID=MMETSP0058-20121206/1499_1 /TAXON_ID=36894 /ORGANISM="Pyramimonas parkeae, CCMP726" /LENGTH=351 /DNA_ID=CAMNT_0001337697 /DNA_START=241 /DNA_END=1296 /DNA_ORIENTATION=+
MGYVSNRLPRDQPGTSAGLTLCDNTVIVPSDRPGKRNAAGDGDAVDVVLTGHGVRYAAQQVIPDSSLKRQLAQLRARARAQFEHSQSTTKSLQQQDTRWHQRLRCRPNSSSGTEFKQDQTKSYQFREAMRRGVDPRLEVRRIPPHHPAFESEIDGFGVFAKTSLKEFGGSIKTGEVLGEYTGEVLTKSEVAARTHVYITDACTVSKKDQSYVFDLPPARGLKGQLCVDARRYRNEMALVNDYRPDRAKYNASAVSIVIDGNPHIFYVATSRIEAGEEVCTDYGPRFWEERELILREHRQIEDAIKIEVQRALSCTHAYPLEVRDGENQRGIPSRAVRVAGGGLRQIGADRS